MTIKEKLLNAAKKKEKGFSSIIGVIFAILLLFVLFYFNFYMQSIKTLKANLTDDADAATMAAATVNLERYGWDYKNLLCIGSANFNTNTLSDEEAKEVLSHVKKYSASLVESMGINNSTDEKLSFKGGNVGWTASVLGAKTFSLDEFRIYDFSQDGKCVCYSISSSSGTITADIINRMKNNGFIGINIQKRILSERNVCSEIPSIGKNGHIPTANRLPTIQARFSFSLNLPKVFTMTNVDNKEISNLTINSVSQAKDFVLNH